MKTVLRLKKLRWLQEQAAEAALIASQAAVSIAVDRLAALDQLQERLRDQALRALLEGDPESAYWSNLEAAAAREERPRMNRLVEEQRAIKQKMENKYLEARIDHLMLGAWLKIETQRIRRAVDLREQKDLDEAYRVQMKPSGRESPIGEAIGTGSRTGLRSESSEIEKNVTEQDTDA